MQTEMKTPPPTIDQELSEFKKLVEEKENLDKLIELMTTDAEGWTIKILRDLPSALHADIHTMVLNYYKDQRAGIMQIVTKKLGIKVEKKAN